MKKALIFVALGFILLLGLTLKYGRALLTYVQVEVNQRSWQSANLTHYRYKLSMGCMCESSLARMPLTIEVRDGSVVSMVDGEGKPVTDLDPDYRTYLDYAAIDNLFSEVKSNLIEGSDKVEVTYDPTYKFPARIDIDRNLGIWDDELQVFVTKLERLP